MVQVELRVRAMGVGARGKWGHRMNQGTRALNAESTGALEELGYESTRVREV